MVVKWLIYDLMVDSYGYLCLMMANQWWLMMVYDAYWWLIWWLINGRYDMIWLYNVTMVCWEWEDNQRIELRGTTLCFWVGTVNASGKLTSTLKRNSAADNSDRNETHGDAAKKYGRDGSAQLPMDACVAWGMNFSDSRLIWIHSSLPSINKKYAPLRCQALAFKIFRRHDSGWLFLYLLAYRSLAKIFNWWVRGKPI